MISDIVQKYNYLIFHRPDDVHLLDHQMGIAKEKTKALLIFPVCHHTSYANFNFDFRLLSKMDIHKSKSLNFLAPSLHVSDVEPLHVSDDEDNGNNDDGAEKTDMSIKSAIEVNVSQERRLSGSLLGANLGKPRPIGHHLNLINSKQYILGTTRVNAKTSSGPTIRPLKPERGVPFSYNTEKVLEGARTALELMETMNKLKDEDSETQSNMGMFYRRTTMPPGGTKAGSLVGSLVQRFEKTKALNSDKAKLSEHASDAETPIYV